MKNIIQVHITEPTILIRINRYYREGMSQEELYEWTRGVWRVGERRNNVTYAMSIYQGIIKGVYRIVSWHKAGTTSYNTRGPETYNIKGRWEFIGKKADRFMLDKYIDKDIKHYFLRGAQNPIFYVNA